MTLCSSAVRTVVGAGKGSCCEVREMGRGGAGPLARVAEEDALSTALALDGSVEAARMDGHVDVPEDEAAVSIRADGDGAVTRGETTGGGTFGSLARAIDFFTNKSKSNSNMGPFRYSSCCAK